MCNAERLEVMTVHGDIGLWLWLASSVKYNFSFSFLLRMNQISSFQSFELQKLFIYSLQSFLEG